MANHLVLGMFIAIKHLLTVFFENNHIICADI